MECNSLSHSSFSYSLCVSAIFDHIGYPSPQLDQWQQCTWYDLGATQDLLHCMQNSLAKGLSESPDSEAEGPFRDSDHTISTPEDSPDTLQ